MIQHRIWSIVYPAFVMIVAACVWFSSQTLPGVVGSHFGPSGQANGFMPREAYAWFMVGLIVVLPVLVVYLPNTLLRKAPKCINLPNRQYWLAPEHREETIDRLCRGSVGFGYLIVVFLGYVHQVVILANRVTPPGLPSEWFIGGLVSFVAASLLWGYFLLRPFLRIPRGSI